MIKDGLVFKKGKSDTGDVVLDTLLNRGIENIDEYRDIDINKVPIINPLKLKNMEKAVKLFSQHIDMGSHIGILVDGDADGFASASLLYKFISKLYENVDLYAPDEKSHGLGPVMDALKKEKYNLLFVPDGGSNDFIYHKELSENGTDIIVLDHHIIDDIKEYENSPAVIVNNQLDDNTDTNYNYVGVGMVFLFIRAYKLIVNQNIKLDVYYPLLALGQITDMSDISDPEIRAQVDKGLSLFKSHKLFKNYCLIKPSSHKVSFEIAPKINAVARVGSEDERYNLLLSLAEEFDENDTSVIYKSRKNRVTGSFEKHPVTLTPYQIESDELRSIKSRQDRLVKKTVDSLQYKSTKDDGIVIAEIDKEIPSAITGLLANKIMAKTQTPTLVIKNIEGKLLGSMRCPGDFEMRSWLNNHTIAKSSGHEQAAGVEFPEDKLDDIIKDANELDVSKSFYEVDALFNEYDTGISPINNINRYVGLFGGKISEPVLGFKSIPVYKNNIHSRGSVITFSYNGLNFVMFNGHNFMDSLATSGSVVYFDVVGMAGESNWDGNTSGQVIIKDIAITTRNKLEFENPEEMVF